MCQPEGCGRCIDLVLNFFITVEKLPCYISTEKLIADEIKL